MDTPGTRKWNETKGGRKICTQSKEWSKLRAPPLLSVSCSQALAFSPLLKRLEIKSLKNIAQSDSKVPGSEGLGWSLELWGLRKAFTVNIRSTYPAAGSHVYHRTESNTYWCKEIEQHERGENSTDIDIGTLSMKMLDHSPKPMYSPPSFQCAFKWLLF